MTRRPIALDADETDGPRGTLDDLRAEVTELRASRKRLVQAADVDRHRLERELHSGLQQQLVALAVNLQRAAPLLDAEPASAKTLLEELGRDVQLALQEAAQLAQRIYPPLLEAAGLATALRAAAESAGARVILGVPAQASYPPETARAIYWCCLDALEHAGAGARVTVSVRGEDTGVAFEIGGETSVFDVGLGLLRDRVEALGGRLTIRSEADGGTRVSGWLPLSE